MSTTDHFDTVDHAATDTANALDEALSALAAYKTMKTGRRMIDFVDKVAKVDDAIRALRSAHRSLTGVKSPVPL
jgi:hypothetical protein